MARTMTATEAAYVAGVVDGEGSFCVSPLKSGGLNMSLSVSNTDGRIIDACIEMTGCGAVSIHPRPTEYQRCWRWAVSARPDMVILVPQLLPYLTSKRDPAALFLACANRRIAGHPIGAEDELAAAQIKAMNGAGKPAPASITLKFA